jgi:7-cyano-7-deazaguanine synthase
MPRAVVLLSGGLDSATILALAQADGFEACALSIDYGQRHRVELERAAALASKAGVTHRVVALDLRGMGGSALTSETAVPKDRSAAEMNAGIPTTYVPARNTLLLGIALGYAETLGALDLFFGANNLDHAGYPDCRPEFFAAFEALANLATKASTQDGGHFRIHTPLIDMSKADIIRTGHRLGVDFAGTLSCYDPDAAGRACGHCDACQLRREGFAEAGIPDPTVYG